MTTVEKPAATTISMLPSTRERLKQIARENHTTVSGMITRWVWDYKLQSEVTSNDTGHKDD